jgi:aspartyl-tRNA(Asn)/glutamyl-tRNA(Gln) amidotransferase subunit B
MGDLAKLLNNASLDIAASPITPQSLAQMIGLIAEGTISGKIAKSLIEEMYNTGGVPIEIVEARGWRTIRDAGAVQAAVDRVFAANPDVVSAIKDKGLTAKRGFLVGQVMKETQGKADPGEVNRLIDAKLAE